jgi:branched-chain amino acid transport system permease protein
MLRLYLLLAAVLAALVAAPLYLDEYFLGILIMVFFYAYLGQCWNILTGYTGHISLGHALYVGLGAYTSTYLSTAYGLSPWLGMILGGLVAAAVGLFMGLLGFRSGLRGVYFVILTIAFAEIGRLVISHVEPLGGFSGIFLDFKPSLANFQFRGNLPYYYVALGFMVFSVAVVRLLELSKPGRCMVAVREDETAAQAIGVDSFRYSMISLGLSAFMTSLAGTFYANYIYYIKPDTVMGMGLSIEMILGPIVGGVGTVLGPVLGSFILSPLRELTRAYLADQGLEGMHLIIYGVLAILVVLFMRKGIIVYLRRLLAPVLRLDR